MTSPVAQEASPPSLGLAALALARVELARGVAEDPPGSNTGPDVRLYLAWCTRNGSRLGLKVGAWCAAFASWCVWRAWSDIGPGNAVANAVSWTWQATWPHGLEPPAPLPPIGYRAAVQELVDDAKATGAWRGAEAAEEPVEGDLLMWAHHIGVCSVWSDSEKSAICGNDGDRVVEVELGVNGEHPSCGTLLGWIQIR